ncbi:MAG: hypothetical protein QOG43_690 [Actinomycetota bacterium]|nr:hypothetical protein [Actinomycetota bacterium]
MSGYDIVAAGPADIGPIMDLEAKAFDPELRASRQTVLDRFALGHHMLVARLRDPDEGGRLVGQISFSFIRFSPDDPSSYPTTFKAHSSQPVLPGANTVCLYSLGVDPADRQVVLFRDLVEGALEMGRQAGLEHAVADGQLPSYNGNDQVKARPEIRRMVQRFRETGAMPTDAEFLHDPALAMYRRLTGCRFYMLLPDFIPDDTASGGWRVLLYRVLTPPTPEPGPTPAPAPG